MQVASSRNQLLLTLVGLEEYWLLSTADPSLLSLCSLYTLSSHLVSQRPTTSQNKATN